LIATVNAKNAEEAEEIIDSELGWLQDKSINEAYTSGATKISDDEYQVTISVGIAKNRQKAIELLEKEIGFIQNDRINRLDFADET
jgi:hypothetical protein